MSNQYLFFTLLCGLLLSFSVAAEEPQPNGLSHNDLPKFPPELVGVKAGDGEVVIAITIDAAGAVSDSVILEATNEAFAASSTLAVSSWRFSEKDLTANQETSPSKQSLAKPPTWPRREVLQFSFKRSGVVTSLSHSEAARESFDTPNVPQLQTVALSALDSPPQRLSATMPSLSDAMLKKLGKQPLSVNFVIDREGKVRVPVVNTEDPELAKVVLAAVKTWTYGPPLHKQQPVAVEITKALVLPKK